MLISAAMDGDNGILRTFPNGTFPPTGKGRNGISEPTRILEFLDLSNVHCLVLLWVTAPCIEMKAPGALESCDFGLSKITSVPR